MKFSIDIDPKMEPIIAARMPAAPTVSYSATTTSAASLTPMTAVTM